MADGVKIKKPAIHTHAGTGLRFVRGTKHVLFETGIVIPRAEFNKLENSGLAERLEELAGEPQNCDFDFAYGCTTGVLRKKKGKADLVANARTERRREKEIKAVTEIKKEEQKKDAAEPFVFSSVLIVMLVMVIVGFGSAIMSAYHTSAFLIEGGKPSWIGILTGIMFILFSGTAFTAARYFLQEKGAQKLFGVLFIAAGFTVIAYSMFSTLTVNFNQFKWADDGKSVTAVENNELLAAHEKLIADNRAALDEVNIRINRIDQEMEYWKTMSWRRYDEFRVLLEEAQAERAELRQRQIELESSKPEIVAHVQNSRETIYKMLSRLLKLPEDTARFFVYVAPACLYDILAPFALSIVLLLTDRRKRKEVQNEGYTAKQGSGGGGK